MWDKVFENMLDLAVTTMDVIGGIFTDEFFVNMIKCTEYMYLIDY